MRYYLGVDGGGTKTEFLWVDEGGRVALNEVLGCSNPNDIGKEAMVDMLVNAVEKGMPKDATSVAVCMGLSGLGFSGCKQALYDALCGMEKVDFVDLCSDVQIALDSAYDGDGCIVIIGTGSVGYLRKKGEHRLIGGCGYIIDSSLSGYDLGREVLNAVCSQADGRGAETLLTELVLSGTKKSVAELVKETYLYGKTFVASFAPYLFTAMEKGDSVAKEILARRVKEWEPLLWGVYKAYGEEVCEITLCGGLTKKWEVISPYLSKEIREKILFKIAQKGAVQGALKRAKKM